MWHVSCHFAKHSTDVQTDVHIVPVDSDAQTCNLLILPTTGGALVLYIGTISLRARHFPITSCAFADTTKRLFHHQ